MVNKIEDYDLPGTNMGDIEPSLGLTALPTGFPTFEANLLFRKKQPDIIVIAGRPGSGKSALGFQIAERVSRVGAVAAFSYEMSKEQLSTRNLMNITQRTEAQLQQPVNAPLIAKARAELRQRQYYVNETSKELNDFENVCRTYGRKQDIALIVVDYVQIMRAAGAQNQKAKISAIMEGVKTLAKDLNTPVLFLAQMNRDFEKRFQDNPKATPTMSDIADAAEIEHWSDQIIMLQKEGPNEVIANVVKNRHGACPRVKLSFSGALVTFTDLGEEDAI